jgi:putative transposase
MVAEHPDYKLAEYYEYCEGKTGVRLSESAMCRFLPKQQLTVKKKTMRNSQADKQRTKKKRIEYWEKMRDVTP